MAWYAGVDLGGTSIKWTAVGDGGAPAAVRSVATPRDPADVLAAIAGCVDTLKDERGVSPAAVCVGTPGLISNLGEFVGPVVNIGGWQGTSPTAELTRLLGVPVTVKNDTTLALLAEVAVGDVAGRASNVVGLFIGTGIGGGLYLDGRLYEGHRGIAGEFGHMVVDPGGRQCGCGSSGCLEQYASGRAIVGLARENANRFDSPLSRALTTTSGEVTAAQVLESPNDPLAAAVIAIAGEMLARAIGSLVMSLAPEMVILGGGVMESGDALLAAVDERLADYTIADALSEVTIQRAGLGQRSGAVGAALYARSSDAARVAVSRS